MADVLVVTSKVKALAAESQLRTSAEAIGALDALVRKTMAAAVKNAQDAGRKTVLGDDVKLVDNQ